MTDSSAGQNREELMLLYQVTVSDMTYFKTQQWSVTNYIFLLLAGLIGVDQLAGPTITSIERVALVVLAWSVALVGLLVLSKLQRSIGVRQSRLEAARQSFGEAFSQAWSAEVKGPEYLHSIWFLRVAVVIGAVLVSWLVLR